MTKKSRQNQCAAFTEMVNVCARHREVWCKHEVSNRAMARFYTSVDMLHEAIDNKEPDYHTPKPGSPHYRVPREKVMQRLVDRVNAVYELLDKPWAGVSRSDVRSRLPLRSEMPVEEKELVAFCTTVYERLAEHPDAHTWEGSMWNVQRMLKAALDQYALCDVAPRPVIQTQQTVGTYRRCFNSCIRALIEMVDPCIPRYAEHRAFQEEYLAARKTIMRLSVDARRTYYVSGYGAASLRHTRAEEWTPWNDPAGQVDGGAL